MRVMLTITSKGWSWIVSDKHGKHIAYHRMVKKGPGQWGGTEKFSVFEEALKGQPELRDAIEEEDILQIHRALEEIG